jgi:hypothetical protein
LTANAEIGKKTSDFRALSHFGPHFAIHPPQLVAELIAPAKRGYEF